MSSTGKVGVGAPTRLRSFDPVRLADLEYRAWVGYYLRQWSRVLIASVGLVRVGFGMDWYRTLHGAWLVLRANQLWAPYPDNDPKGARACMRRFYALVRLTYGEPVNPAKAAELEVDWWRVHREGQHREGARSVDDAEPAGELVESLVRLYCYLYGEPEAALRPAAYTGPGPWTCPMSGSGKAAGQTAACSRWSTRRWSVPTPLCWPPSTTRNGRRGAPAARVKPGSGPRP